MLTLINLSETQDNSHRKYLKSKILIIFPFLFIVNIKGGIIIKIEIQKELEIELLKYSKENIIILNFDDGVGLFSDQQATCGLAVLFDLIIINKKSNIDLIDFNQSIDTTIGEIKIKGYSTDFLDDINYLKTNHSGTISLIGEYSGLIDGNVRIMDYTNKTINHSPIIKGDVLS